jgi:hypothetical protein
MVTSGRSSSLARNCLLVVYPGVREYCSCSLVRCQIWCQLEGKKKMPAICPDSLFLYGKWIDSMLQKPKGGDQEDGVIFFSLYPLFYLC